VYDSKRLLLCFSRYLLINPRTSYQC